MLNPKYCRSVLIFFVSNSTLYRVNGVLFQLRYVTRITRCVNLIRCPICPHPMLSKANRLLPCLLTVYFHISNTYLSEFFLSFAVPTVRIFLIKFIAQLLER